MKSVTPITVRSTELDAYGHVNNAKYLEYFEWGRFDWVEALALPAPVAERLSFVVANVNVNFRKEARRGDALNVETRLTRRGRSSLELSQVLRNARGETVADAVVTGVTFDPVARKSAPIPDDLAPYLDAALSREPEVG